MSRTKEQARGRGQPAFQPSDLQRRTVELLSTYGVPAEQIASVVEAPNTGRAISTVTLNKYFAEELRVGRTRSKAIATVKLFDLINRGNARAVIFYLKTQCGWGAPTASGRTRGLRQYQSYLADVPRPPAMDNPPTTRTTQERPPEDEPSALAPEGGPLKEGSSPEISDNPADSAAPEHRRRTQRIIDSAGNEITAEEWARRVQASLAEEG